MFCPNCGSEVSRSSNFCFNCREDLRQHTRKDDMLSNHEHERIYKEYKSSEGKGVALPYLKDIFLNPLSILKRNQFNFPLIPLIIVLAGILLNTIIAINAIKNIIIRLVASIIENISFPEISLGNEYLDEIAGNILDGTLNDWIDLEYYIENIISYINPVLISIVVMIFFLLLLVYNVLFLYFIPRAQLKLSKILTDYSSLIIFPTVITSFALILMNFGLVVVGIYLLLFSLVMMIYLSTYQFLYYKNIKGSRIDTIYTLLIYLMGIIVLYFLIMHNLILRTYHQFVEQLNLLMDYLMTF